MRELNGFELFGSNRGAQRLVSYEGRLSLVVDALNELDLNDMAFILCWICRD